jgi:hypothetical protein
VTRRKGPGPSPPSPGRAAQRGQICTTRASAQSGPRRFQDKVEASLTTSGVRRSTSVARVARPATPYLTSAPRSTSASSRRTTARGTREAVSCGGRSRVERCRRCHRPIGGIHAHCSRVARESETHADASCAVAAGLAPPLPSSAAVRREYARRARHPVYRRYPKAAGFPDER